MFPTSNGNLAILSWFFLLDGINIKDTKKDLVPNGNLFLKYIKKKNLVIWLEI